VESTFRREAGADRIRIVGIRRGHVGPRDRRHGLALDEPVHVDIHVVDARVVQRPAGRREDAAGFEALSGSG